MFFTALLFLSAHLDGILYSPCETEYLSSISLPCQLQKYEEEYLMHTQCGENEMCPGQFKVHRENCRYFKCKRSFSCDICRKHFSHKFLLEKHFLLHEQSSSFDCEFCGMNFRKSSNLKLHLLKHRLRNFSPPNPFDVLLKLGVICV